MRHVFFYAMTKTLTPMERRTTGMVETKTESQRWGCCYSSEEKEYIPRKDWLMAPPVLTAENDEDGSVQN